MQLTRDQRRIIRAIVAVLQLISIGTITLPHFVPDWLIVDIKEIDAFIVAVFLTVNPFLDAGAKAEDPDLPDLGPPPAPRLR